MLTHSHLLTFFKTLNEHKVKYAVVGGLAANLHGYQRFTKDVDLLISLEEKQVTQFIQTLKSMEFKPIYPIPLEDFCSEENRDRWISEKNMTVFSVVSDSLIGLTLDIFVRNPYHFQDIENDLVYETIGTEQVPVIDLARLIEMKKNVARPQDLLDVQALEKIRDEHLS